MAAFNTPREKLRPGGLQSSWLRRAAYAAFGVLMIAPSVSEAQYLVTNDDTGVGFYTVSTNGALTLSKEIVTSLGTVGGFFGANRIEALNSNGQRCIYASVASSGAIVGISVSSLSLAQRATGSDTDNGSANGIGLAVNSQYLYASYPDSNTIGIFAVEAGCGLAFISDLSVRGLSGGQINGMAIHGSMMIATFTDGTIQSFNISSGMPVSNDDAKYSTATLSSAGATYPNSIDITKDGHFAIFGDTSSSTVIEVSDLSKGHLKATQVYSSSASISSSNVILSPDQSVLYVVNTQGASVSAFLFDKKNGKLTFGCKSAALRGQSSQWSYLGAAGLIDQIGTGGGVYIAEFGAPSGVAMVTLGLSSSGKCSLHENAQSPFADNNSQGLVSIGTFPPRAF
jgi:hypothetical protein